MTEVSSNHNATLLEAEVTNSDFLRMFAMSRVLYTLNRMEANVAARLPLSDPTRIKARERKLWHRELSAAIQEQLRSGAPVLKMSCPCKLCNRGWGQEKYVRTVIQHLDASKMYGRDPSNYGSTKVCIHIVSSKIFKQEDVTFLGALCWLD